MRVMREEPESTGPGGQRRSSRPSRRVPTELPGGAALFLLDALDFGVYVVTQQAVLVWSNRAARQALVDGRPFRLAGTRLTPAEADDAAGWNRFLRDAAGGHPAHWQGLLDRGFWIMRLPEAGTSGPLIAILVSRDCVCSEVVLDQVVQAHGLSPAERRVLAMLGQGATPAAIAERFGISESTVRSQIRGLLEKSGAASIRSLLISLACWPAIDKPVRPSG